MEDCQVNSSVKEDATKEDMTIEQAEETNNVPKHTKNISRKTPSKTR